MGFNITMYIRVGIPHNVVNHSDYIHEFQISLYILVPRLWFQRSLGFSYHCSHQPWQTWVSIFLTQLLTWDGIKYWSIYTQDTPSLLTQFNCTYPMHWMEAWSLSAWIHFFHWEIAECTYSLYRLKVHGLSHTSISKAIHCSEATIHLLQS